MNDIIANSSHFTSVKRELRLLYRIYQIHLKYIQNITENMQVLEKQTYDECVYTMQSFVAALLRLNLKSKILHIKLKDMFISMYDNRYNFVYMKTHTITKHLNEDMLRLISKYKDYTLFEILSERNIQDIYHILYIFTQQVMD